MNFNAIIAVLVIKQILTREEADSLVQHLNDKPQSSELRDAIIAVSEVIGAAVPANIMTQIPSVGPTQQAEELAARSQAPVAQVAPPPTPLEPANTQGPDTVTGPDQSGNPASLESKNTDHEPNAAPEKEDPTTGKSSSDKKPNSKHKKK